MKKVIKLLIISISMVTFAYGASEAKFPANWASFTPMNTPLTSIGALPGCEADVSSLPPIYQETVATYCAVKSGGPGAVAVLTNNPAEFKARSGKYSDGTVHILHLKDLQLFFVTEYKGNKPLYGIWTEGGQDASNALGSGLNPQDCRACHTGYEAFCVNGQCATAQ